ncbi:MAG: hypothetical protein M1565_04395 [Actinobacteria bacterium]|nr:hypothetical protein [Actinomycetota bacterium]MCL5735213.1 hypothetical protein [Actinomycetota bacterium]
MTNKKKPERNITIRSVLRNPPDYSKLGRALVALAMAEAEAEAQAEVAKEATKNPETPPSEEAA